MLAQIQLSVVDPPVFFDRIAPKAHKVGLRTVYTEDVQFNGQAAGTHSGVLTTLRTNFSNPGPFQCGTLIEDQGTYDLGAVPGLAKGQVTVRGLVPIDTKGNPHAGGATIRLAITGGTEAYKNARGQLSRIATSPFHTLDIEF